MFAKPSPVWGIAGQVAGEYVVFQAGALGSSLARPSQTPLTHVNPARSQPTARNARSWHFFLATWLGSSNRKLHLGWVPHLGGKGWGGRGPPQQGPHSEVPAGGVLATAPHRAGASGLLSARASKDPTRDLFFRVSPGAGCGLESSWKISVSFAVSQFDH